MISLIKITNLRKFKQYETITKHMYANTVGVQLYTKYKTFSGYSFIPSSYSLTVSKDCEEPSVQSQTAIACVFVSIYFIVAKFTATLKNQLKWFSYFK